MALATVEQVKTYLRIEHTDEDELLTDLLAQATALIESYIGRPILQVERTFTDEADSARGFATGRLLFPVTPVDPETVEITDRDEAEVVATTFRVDGLTGVVRGVDGALFGNGPYNLVGEVGLEAFPDYESRIEPVINRALIDTVADWYQHRNPSAQAEGSGGGVYTQWASSLALPARVELAIRSFRVPG